VPVPISMTSSMTTTVAPINSTVHFNVTASSSTQSTQLLSVFASALNVPVSQFQVISRSVNGSLA
jgi:hypothetical protein